MHHWYCVKSEELLIITVKSLVNIQTKSNCDKGNNPCSATAQEHVQSLILFVKSNLDILDMSCNVNIKGFTNNHQKTLNVLFINIDNLHLLFNWERFYIFPQIVFYPCPTLALF